MDKVIYKALDKYELNVEIENVKVPKKIIHHDWKTKTYIFTGKWSVQYLGQFNRRKASRNKKKYFAPIYCCEEDNNNIIMVIYGVFENGLLMKDWSVKLDEQTGSTTTKDYFNSVIEEY